MNWLLDLIPVVIKEIIELIHRAVDGDATAAKRVADILPPSHPLRSRLMKESADARAKKKFGQAP